MRRVNNQLISYATTCHAQCRAKRISSKQDDSALTVDRLLGDLVLCGTVNQVLALREEIGGFGELACAGMDLVDRKLGERSMALMAEQVMPKVNAALQQRGNAAQPYNAQPVA